MSEFTNLPLEIYPLITDFLYFWEVASLIKTSKTVKDLVPYNKYRYQAAVKISKLYWDKRFKSKVRSTLNVYELLQCQKIGHSCFCCDTLREVDTFLKSNFLGILHFSHYLVQEQRKGSLWPFKLKKKYYRRLTRSLRDGPTSCILPFSTTCSLRNLRLGLATTSEIYDLPFRNLPLVTGNPFRTKKNCSLKMFLQDFKDDLENMIEGDISSEHS